MPLTAAETNRAAAVIPAAAVDRESGRQLTRHGRFGSTGQKRPSKVPAKASSVTLETVSPPADRNAHLIDVLGDLVGDGREVLAHALR